MIQPDRLLELTGGVRIFYPTGGDRDLMSPADENATNLRNSIAELTSPHINGFLVRVAKDSKPISTLNGIFGRIFGERKTWKDYTPDIRSEASLIYKRRHNPRLGGDGLVIDINNFRQRILDGRKGHFLAQLGVDIKNSEITRVSLKFRSPDEEGNYFDFVKAAGKNGEVIDKTKRVAEDPEALTKLEITLIPTPLIVFEGFSRVSKFHWAYYKASAKYYSGSDNFFGVNCNDFGRGYFMDCLGAVLELTPGREVIL